MAIETEIGSDPQPAQRHKPNDTGSGACASPAGSTHGPTVAGSTAAGTPGKAEHPRPGAGPTTTGAAEWSLPETIKGVRHGTMVLYGTNRSSVRLEKP